MCRRPFLRRASLKTLLVSLLIALIPSASFAQLPTSGTTVTEEGVVSAAEGVDLLRTAHAAGDLKNRYDYRVFNGRNHPVYATITVTACENCRNALIVGQVLVDPGQTVSVGSLEQAVRSQSWLVNIQWRWVEAR
jgi:hypothetical protein